MLHGATVRSDVARGRIRGIDFDPGDPLGRVRDRHRRRHSRQESRRADRRRSAVSRRRRRQSSGRADRAAGASRPHAGRRRRGGTCTYDIEPLPAVFSIDDGAGGPPIIWGTDNIFKSYLVSRGDVDAAFAGAAIVVEGEYETGAQEQLYIEPNGMLAVANPEDGVTVWGSMQCPYYVHNALAPLFGLPARQDPRRADGDRRRLRRQGRVSVADRRPRGAARLEVRPAGEDDLRPRRGHGRDDQAPSVADAASHGGRRATAGCSRWTSTS